MKYRKKAISTLLLTASALMVGCGSSTTIIVTDDSSANSTTTTDTQTLVKVIDGYILNSTVMDSDGNKAEFDKEKNVYNSD